MRKLVFNTDKASVDTFKVLYAGVINGPPPQDYDEAERNLGLIRKLKNASEEASESDALNRTFEYRTPIAGAEVVIENAEFKYLQTALEAFMKKQQGNHLLEQVLAARKFLTDAPVVTPTKTEVVAPAAPAAELNTAE